jgi:predicted nucleotidyltransferase
MKDILGVVAEYNPMHLGHAHHLKRAVGETGCKYTIIAMSGNFVQRGEPAITDKWTRAKMAVAAGADAVVEIPAWFALQSAEGFARAGVSLLQYCGATHISFGSESGTISDLREMASWLQLPGTQSDIRRWLQTGITYAAAVQRAAEQSKAVSRLGQLFQGANNILAIEYLRAMENTNLIAHSVKRIGAASASELRQLLAQGKKSDVFEQHIHPCGKEILLEAFRRAGPVYATDFTPAIFYALLCLGPDGVSSLPACSEGLENRLFNALGQARDLADLLKAVKTKRYPLTRIQRLLMQALLRFNAVNYQGNVPYLRLLAISDRGKKLLPGMAKSPVPLLYSARDIRKLSPHARVLLEADFLAEKVYQMAQNLKAIPLS